MSGIVGVYSKSRTDVALLTYYGLYGLQHRGEVSAGIAVNNNGFVDYFKEMGLVHEVFTEETMKRLMGNIAIGQARYAKGEPLNTTNAQPIVAGYRNGALAAVHDGAIVNFEKLRKDLEENGAMFQSQLDTEVVTNLIARNHKGDLEEAVIKTLDQLDATYGLILMTSDTLIGARDPFGIKPLVLGEIDGDYILASETCGLDTMGAEFIRDILPGEIVFINEDGVKSIQRPAEERKLCIFETIYFGRPDSQLDGESIYLSRIEAGRQLFREAPAPEDIDIVIGAPDSGIVASIGYAEESGIPYAEGMIKNRYIGRTFIQPTQELRETGVRIKLNPLKENIKGKKVLLVDDSIVRGTTITQTVKMLKDAGANEVHIRIAAPPVRYTCHLWMHSSPNKYLIAKEMSEEDIERVSGADSLEYLSIEGLLNATCEKCSFCTGCLDGVFPIPKY